MDRKTKKKLVNFGLFVAVLVLIVSTLNVILTIEAKKMIKKDLTKFVFRSTEGLYSLEAGNLHINLISGFVSVQDISFILNKDRFNELYQDDSLPKYYGTLKVKELNFDGLDFRYRKNPRKRKFFLKSIDVVEPLLSIVDNQEEGSPTDKSKDERVKINNKAPYELIAPYFDVLDVSSIKIKDGTLDFYSKRKEDTTTILLKNINIEAKDFLIDSLAEKRGNFLYSKDFHLLIDTVHSDLPNNLYSLNTGQVEMSVSDSILRISDMNYISKYPKWDFAYHDPMHSDWMDLKVGNVVLKGIHIQTYINEKKLFLDSAWISNTYFKNYKNQKIPITHNTMPMIYEPIQKFPIPFSISYVKASNINVDYEELDKKGIDPGFISFTQMEGVFEKGITNIVKSHTQTNKLLVSGKLMNQGLINAELYFPVDTTYDRVRIKGTLGTMNMISLNKIIEPMVPLSIKKGFIQGMKYEIEGGKEKATINMCLEYNELMVNVLLPMGEKHRSNKSILSFIVNALIQNNNPGVDGKTRCVRTEHIRDPYHSSFNYLWKIYLSGLVETLGFTQKRQRNLKWLQENLN